MDSKDGVVIRLSDAEDLHRLTAELFPKCQGDMIVENNETSSLDLLHRRYDRLIVLEGIGICLGQLSHQLGQPCPGFFQARIKRTPSSSVAASQSSSASSNVGPGTGSVFHG